MRQKSLRGREWLAAEATRRGGCADYGLSAPGWDGNCFAAWTAENYLFCEWDHLPEFIKTFELARSAKPIERLAAEAAKCEPVCHNHHLLRTMRRRLGE